MPAKSERRDDLSDKEVSTLPRYGTDFILVAAPLRCASAARPGSLI
jgi:hypothetical protein